MTCADGWTRCSLASTSNHSKRARYIRVTSKIRGEQLLRQVLLIDNRFFEIIKTNTRDTPQLTLYDDLRLCGMHACVRTPEKRQTKVDGSFLVELRESDLIDPLGMEHKLHIKKLLLAREKLMPMSEAEQMKARPGRIEEFPELQPEGVPDIDTAFSQVFYRRHIFTNIPLYALQSWGRWRSNSHCNQQRQRYV